MKISLLSNININSIIRKMGREIYTPAGYGAWYQEIVDLRSELYKYESKAVFIILDAEQLFSKMNHEEIKEEIKNYFISFRKIFSIKKNISFFVSTIDFFLKEIRSNDELRIERMVEIEWYVNLNKLVNSLSNVHVFDLKALVINEGRKKFYSDKLWYLGGMKFSVKGEELIKEEIEKNLKALSDKKKKCLILDLDNTLWGGVIGEDGLNGIELSEYKEGARFKDFQKRLKELKEKGVILSIVSKNNANDVNNVFDKHKHMVLRREDFVSMKINWKPKPQNIKEIAKELNIGLDSIVFIDDNPVEREFVRESLPEVIVPEFPKDTSKLVDFVNDVYNKYFFILRITKEDEKKTEMYLQNAKRSQFKKEVGSLEDFLKGLETKICIWKLKEEDIPRAAQLTQKTNQFNLTTRRYTESDIRKFASDENYDVYIASVEDKFGDNGKVVLIILKKERKKEAEIDTFLMSCRVMGRYIEDQIIDFIEDKMLDEGIERLIVYYYLTKKNKPVENLFERLGYKTEKIENGKKYKLDLKQKPSRREYSKLLPKE